MSLMSRVATTMAKTRLAANGGVRLLATETAPKETPNPEDIMQGEFEFPSRRSDWQESADVFSQISCEE